MINNLQMETRQNARTRCRITGTVKYMNQVVDVRVVDLSETGIKLDVRGPFTPPPKGFKLEIRTPELGFLEGTLQWTRGTYIGLSLHLSSATAAQLRSYFRYFHEEIKPVLRPDRA